MTTIADRLSEVRRAVAEAARSAGRDPAEVRVVAVSKRVGVESVRDAIAAGQLDFGENYVQEAVAKQEAIDDAAVRWHLIGNLQSNKARRVAGRFALFHSVSTASALRALSRAASAREEHCRVLLQIHLGGGTARAGVPAARALEFARAAMLPGIVLDGVMGVAPVGVEPRPSFEQLRRVLERLRAEGLPGAPLREMSAGMSSDFREAILEGATIVRIGTAIFGSRAEASAPNDVIGDR